MSIYVKMYRNDCILVDVPKKDVRDKKKEGWNICIDFPIGQDFDIRSLKNLNKVIRLHIKNPNDIDVLINGISTKKEEIVTDDELKSLWDAGVISYRDNILTVEGMTEPLGIGKRIKKKINLRSRKLESGNITVSALTKNGSKMLMKTQM